MSLVGSCLHLACCKALLTHVQAETRQSLADKFPKEFQCMCHLSSLQEASRTSSGIASSDCQKNVFWMIQIIRFRWKNKKSCNEWAAQAKAEPKQNFLLMSKSYQHAKHAIDWSSGAAGCLSLPKSSCILFIYFIKSTVIWFHTIMRCTHESPKPFRWVTPNSIYYSIFFPSLKWSFWMKTICPALCTLLPSLGHTRHSPCEECQFHLGQALTAVFFWYLHQLVFPQALRKELVHFLRASMYNSLHVQLFGEFWSRLSHARTHFAPVESRTELCFTFDTGRSTPQLPRAFPKLSVKLFILQFFPTKKGKFRVFSVYEALEDAAEYLAAIRAVITDLWLGFWIRRVCLVWNSMQKGTVLNPFNI